MMPFVYLSLLVISIFGMVMIDRRFKLAFFHDARRTALTLCSAVIAFIVWDLAGIALGIFSKGASAFSLEYELLPELPIEELFFLLLLSYLSLLSYLYFKRRSA